MNAEGEGTHTEHILVSTKDGDTLFSWPPSFTGALANYHGADKTVVFSVSWANSGLLNLWRTRISHVDLPKDIRLEIGHSKAGQSNICAE